MVNGQITAVIERAGRPFVHLDAGTHRITGLLDWNTPPSSLQVPKGIAQIKCQSNGQVQQTEYRTTEGILGCPQWYDTRFAGPVRWIDI